MFSVIALENIIIESKALQVLILAPTREIAIQISQVIKTLSKPLKKIKCHAFIVGQSINEDKMKLKCCHIAVVTPGILYRKFFLSVYFLSFYYIRQNKSLD